MNLWKCSNYSSLCPLFRRIAEPFNHTAHRSCVEYTVLAAHWNPENGHSKKCSQNSNSSLCSPTETYRGLVLALSTTLPVEKPQTWNPVKMQPPPQNLHLMLTKCPHCKTLFHLRLEGWVSHCVFPLKASRLAFCSDFLMQPFWTQMYFEMSKLLTSYWWVEQWFDLATRGWMGVLTVLFLLRSDDTAHHHFFCRCFFDLFHLQPFF